jgi:hypothetical protein
MNVEAKTSLPVLSGEVPGLCKKISYCSWFATIFAGWMRTT